MGLDFRPTPGGGGGGGAIVPVFLSHDDVVTSTKPGSITGGSIAMNGNLWEVTGYASTATKHNGFGNPWRLTLPLPAGLLDNSGNCLWHRIKVTTPPTLGCDVRLQIGVYEPGIVGIGGGLEMLASGTSSRAIASLLNSTTEGADVPDLTAQGFTMLPGVWNNSNLVGGSTALAVSSSTKGGGAGGQNGLTACDATVALMCVTIGTGSSVAALAQDFAFTAEFAVVALPA